VCRQCIAAAQRKAYRSVFERQISVAKLHALSDLEGSSKRRDDNEIDIDSLFNEQLSKLSALHARRFRRIQPDLHKLFSELG